MNKIFFLLLSLIATSISAANETSCNDKSECIGYAGCTPFYVMVCNKQYIDFCQQKLTEHCSHKKVVAWEKPTQDEMQKQIACVNNQCTINNIWLKK